MNAEQFAKWARRYAAHLDDLGRDWEGIDDYTRGVNAGFRNTARAIRNNSPKLEDDIFLTAKDVAVLTEWPDLVLLGGNGESNVVLTGTAEEISELIRYMQRTLRVHEPKNCREA